MKKSKSPKGIKLNYLSIILLATIIVFINTFLPSNTDGKIVLALYIILFFLLGTAGFIVSKKTKKIKEGVKIGAITALVSFGLPLLVLSIINKSQNLLTVQLAGLIVVMIVGAILGAIGAEVRIKKLFK